MKSNEVKPTETDFIYPYLKSEMDRQIVLLKSLGINYPESGYLFEQCINTVFMMIEKKKEEVSWDEAFDEYSKDRGKTTHFVSWVKDNYTLIRK